MKLLALTMGVSGFLLNLLGASNVQYEIRAEDAIENEKQQLTKSTRTLLPVVINTWAFTNATQRAWDVLSKGDGSALDAVEQGCTVCEDEQCDGTVGFGGSPDETGETTLDAMIMDGPTHSVGAVASMKRIKHAISVARKVMEHTQHTFLVGEAATKFAVQMGFEETNLSTENSINLFQNWASRNCQPNFWKDVVPNPKLSCGPYRAIDTRKKHFRESETKPSHDTIGMLAIDKDRKIASGTSTNGATFKIPGRVGDSSIAGAGSYVDQEVGGAAATGDGDILMRFLPSFTAVEYMRLGMTPSTAASYALKRISQYYPEFNGAVVALKIDGSFGAACHGFKNFTYAVANSDLKEPFVFYLPCANAESVKVEGKRSFL